MKRICSAAFAAVTALTLTGCGTSGSSGAFSVLLLILGLLLAIFALLRTRQYLAYRKRRQKLGRKYASIDMLTVLMYILALVALVGALLIPGKEPAQIPASTEPSTEATTVPTEPPVLFVPGSVSASKPSNWGISWEIYQNGSLVPTYSRPDPINFGTPESYFSLPGIAGFRGNNYRNDPTYGTANVVNKTVSTKWTAQTGTLDGGVWSGSGWTGQPLIVKWDTATKQNMNLYPAKQNKADLVEVIYATLDGHIYFLDLEDGSATRDPISVGLCFKGAGALDPRGYPIMYVGSGDVNAYGEKPGAYIISLIDGSILYRFGTDDPLSLRKDNSNWCAFDSSPLVDAETDTLIWPGENGILYTMKLNTQYDPASGTLSVSPSDRVVARYSTNRSNADTYWYGYEASVSVAEGYLYVSENGGMFYCIDLNTMELVWAQDTRDDSNCSPVFERTGEDTGYIYTAPSLHWTQSSDATGTIDLYKLDAVTGEVVWQKPYSVHTVSGVSGGVQSTPALGKPGTNLENKIFFTISRTPDVYTGLLVALDTTTGAELWRMTMDHYAWSSPVAVYDNSGKGYLAVCDSAGTLFLLDGATGAVLDTLSLGGLVEATPAIYENTLVVGTRSEQILAITIG